MQWSERVGIVDVIIIGITLLSCMFGVFRGLIKEALSLAFWIGAALLAMHFDTALAPRLAVVSDSAVVRQGAAFVLIFVGTVFLGALISTGLSKLMSRAGLGGADRALGGLFGIIRGVVIATVLVVIAGMLSARVPALNEILGASILVPYLIELADSFRALIGIEAPLAAAP